MSVRVSRFGASPIVLIVIVLVLVLVIVLVLEF